MSQEHRTDVDKADLTGEKRFAFDPSDDVVYLPRHYHEGGRGRKVPAKDWRVEENEDTIRPRNDKLEPGSVFISDKAI